MPRRSRPRGSARTRSARSWGAIPRGGPMTGVAHGPAACAIAVAEELDRIMRSDRGRSGPPASPQGWLLQVARRKAIDRLRGATRDTRKVEAPARLTQDDAGPEPEAIAGDRLRLVFTCRHPALGMTSRVALTLRTVCGLTTADIARAFLDADPTTGQRLSRAKTKIAATGIPFAVPVTAAASLRRGASPRWNCDSVIASAIGSTSRSARSMTSPARRAAKSSAGSRVRPRANDRDARPLLPGARISRSRSSECRP